MFKDLIWYPFAFLEWLAAHPVANLLWLAFWMAAASYNLGRVWDAWKEIKAITRNESLWY